MLDDLTTSDTLFTDEEGYVWEVIASVIGENNKRIAWVEWREKESGRITTRITIYKQEMIQGPYWCGRFKWSMLISDAPSGF